MSHPGLNTIKEVAPGVHWALLEFPTSALLAKLLDRSVPLVLCWNHHVGSWRWEDFVLPVVQPDRAMTVRSRNASFDFLLETDRFLQLLPSMGPGIQVVQLHAVPPDWLELSRIDGPSLWRALNDIGWHVLLDTPGNDFGQVASPHRSVIEHAIELCREDPSSDV